MREADTGKDLARDVNLLTSFVVKTPVICKRGIEGT